MPYSHCDTFLFPQTAITRQFVYEIIIHELAISSFMLICQAKKTLYVDCNQGSFRLNSFNSKCLTRNLPQKVISRSESALFYKTSVT